MENQVSPKWSSGSFLSGFLICSFLWLKQTKHKIPLTCLWPPTRFSATLREWTLFWLLDPRDPSVLAFPDLSAAVQGVDHSLLLEAFSSLLASGTQNPCFVLFSLLLLVHLRPGQTVLFLWTNTWEPWALSQCFLFLVCRLHPFLPALTASLPHTCIWLVKLCLRPCFWGPAQICVSHYLVNVLWEAFLHWGSSKPPHIFPK